MELPWWSRRHCGDVTSEEMTTVKKYLIGLAAAAVLALLGGAATPGFVGHALADGGGNSDAAHACQQGGYSSLQQSNGTGFSNTGQCVSYAAHGGTLFAPVVTVTSPITAPGIGQVSQPFTVTGTGFHPSSTGTLTCSASWGSCGTWGTPTTNASGAFSFGPTAWLIGVPCDFTATFTYTDAAGVHAAGTQVVHGCGS